jgi:two-component system phosphate regulon sensor histidine kinase PhoR
MNTTLDTIQFPADIFVAALHDAALMVEANGTIISSNKAADGLLRFNCKGENIVTVLRSPAMVEGLANAFKTGTEQQVQINLRHAVTLALEVNISILDVKNHHAGLALIVCKDVTYAQQIEKMRSDFVANASHELRTPLTTLSGFIETMQGAGKNDVKAHPGFLKMMKSQADRMARLIDDLLSLSRIEVSEHVAPDANVDIASVVRQTASLLEPLRAELSCRIELQLPDHLVVLGDEGQLTQVIHNLLENALRYSGKEKTIIVRVEKSEDANIISVIDNGPGIEAHHVPRLTERFYRVDSRNRGGTGLGLAICKHIINRHRGKLVIESELGKGSCFSIQLPC